MLGLRLFLIKVFLFISVFYCSAQNSRHIEEIGLSFLCLNSVEFNDIIQNYNISFCGKTNGRASKIMDVANCFEDVLILKDSVPNKVELDRIDSLNNLIKRYPKSINKSCFGEGKNSFFNKKRIVRLIVYDSIEYKNNRVVEYFLLNQKIGWYKIFTVRFSIDMKPIEYCTYSIWYK